MHPGHVAAGGKPCCARTLRRRPRRGEYRMWTDPVAADPGAAHVRLEQDPGIATYIPRA